MDQSNASTPPHYHNYNSPKGSSLAKPISAIILLVIVAALGFFAGISYEKGHNKSPLTADTASSRYGAGSGGYSGGFGGQRPTFGTVAAISSTSISVQDSRSDTNETLAITSSTTITDNGQSVSASDIQTGETVAVFASSTNSSQASKILVNPSYGGGNSSTAPTSESID
jgi:hypothetical protein